jgi:hypothetical protein
VNAYLRSHPGAVYGTGHRAVYSDGFRRFVVQLLEQGEAGQELSTAELADLTGVPLGTLKAWLSWCPPAASSTPEPAAEPANQSVSNIDALRSEHHRLIVTLWKGWQGSFQAFCATLQREHRVQYGDTYIGNLLEAVGLRQRRRRMPVEAPWSSGTYRRPFAGGQWLGDGTDLPIYWGPKKYVFNLEELKDVGTDATIGFAVTDSESEAALGQAYQLALETTVGQPPEVLMLDNKPCNHSPGAQAATPGTTLVRSTPGRGQAKAPLEGAFGLFQQTMPALVVPAGDPREQARHVVNLIMIAWYRGRNSKPRKRLNGKTPAEAYMQANVCTAERDELQAWMRQQEQARATRDARRDPVRIALLQRGLAELDIPDPDGRLAKALAYYCIDAIVRGLATFRAKKDLGKLPPGADHGRYLGGIIRQLDTQSEMELTMTYLLEQRRRLGELTLRPLEWAADKVRATVPPAEQARAFVDRCLDAQVEVDARFWMGAASQALAEVPLDTRETSYLALCRRAAASFSTDRQRRADLIDQLAVAAVTPETVRRSAAQSTSPALLQPAATPLPAIEHEKPDTGTAGEISPRGP